MFCIWIYFSTASSFSCQQDYAVVGTGLILTCILALSAFNSSTLDFVSDSLFSSHPLAFIPWSSTSYPARDSRLQSFIFVRCHFYATHAPCVCSHCSTIQEWMQSHGHTCLESLMRTIHCNAQYCCTRCLLC